MSLLDKYRKEVTEDRVKVETQAGRPYKAFEVAPNPQRRLDLRPGYAAQRMVFYSYITEIYYAGDFMVDLLFHGYPLHVAIRGKNLGELISRLREERVTTIAEFIPEWHARPEEGQPIVESLVIEKPGRPAAKGPDKH